MVKPTKMCLIQPKMQYRTIIVSQNRAFYSPYIVNLKSSNAQFPVLFRRLNANMYSSFDIFLSGAVSVPASDEFPCVYLWWGSFDRSYNTILPGIKFFQCQRVRFSSVRLLWCFKPSSTVIIIIQHFCNMYFPLLFRVIDSGFSCTYYFLEFEQNVS